MSPTSPSTFGRSLLGRLCSVSGATLAALAALFQSPGVRADDLQAHPTMSQCRSDEPLDAIPGSADWTVDGIIAVCGAGGIPGSRSFRGAWMRHKEECVASGVPQALLDRLAEMPVIANNDLLGESVDCEQVYRLVVDFGLAHESAIAHWREEALVMQEQALAIELGNPALPYLDTPALVALSEAYGGGNLQAGFLLAVALIDIDGADYNYGPESVAGIDMFTPLAEAGYGEQIYAYLSDMQERYPSTGDGVNHLRAMLIDDGYRALSRAGFARATLWLAEEQVRETMSYYDRGEYPADSEFDYARQLLETARSQGDPTVSARVAELERHLDDALASEVTPAESLTLLLGGLAAIAAMAPEPSANTTNDVLENQERRRQECRDMAASAAWVDMEGVARAWGGC